MAKLTLNAFNDMMFSAIKELTPEKKKELLEIELDIVIRSTFGRIYNLCDELTEIGYESELFTEIGNLKDNGVTLIEQIEELEKQIAEEEKK